MHDGHGSFPIARFVLNTMTIEALQFKGRLNLFSRMSFYVDSL